LSEINDSLNIKTHKTDPQKDILKQDKRFLSAIVPISAFIGGLCCFTPVVLVLLGLSTIAAAASLTDLLYYEYRWAFRAVALLFLLSALFTYFYFKENVCTLNLVKQNRTRIINLTLITIICSIIAYIIWLYVIVEIIGILLGIW
jgi:predicted ferric reductase